MKRITLLLVLVSCAPTYRVVTKKCPTTTMLLGDFGLSAVAMGLSALNYNLDHTAGAVVMAGAAAGLMVGANLAETTCRKTQ